MCRDDRWLQRWPRCCKVNLQVHDYGTLVIPFAAIPHDEARRITTLHVACGDEDPLNGGHLLALLQRLPRLELLGLWTPAPADDDPHFPLALSMLPNLTALRLGDLHGVTLIPRSLWGQLTRLELNNRMWYHQPPCSFITDAFSQLTALRRLTLKPERERGYFCCEDVLELLESVPRSVEQLDMWKVDPMPRPVHCFLEAGQLQTVQVSDRIGGVVTLEGLSELIKTALLPSSKLGPRLPRLEINGPFCLTKPRIPAPTAAFFGRCDTIALDELITSFSAQSTVSAIRLLGMPAVLSSRQSRIWSVTLGGTARGPGGPRQAPVPPGVLLLRAVQRVAAAATAYGSNVLLTGPPLQSLLADPTALKAWLEELTTNARGDTGSAYDGSCPWLDYCALRPVGALVLSSSLVGPDALIREARRLVQGGSSSGPGFEAWQTDLQWEKAVGQVLQALWDGEESWGPESASGGAGASGSSGQGGGSEGGELDRLQILLESWDGALKSTLDGEIVKTTWPAGLSPKKLLDTCHDGFWLQRWPRCCKVRLRVDDYGALVIPFAAVPMDEARRITKLHVCSDNEGPLNGGNLLALLQRLPRLELLGLWTTAPAAAEPVFPLALSVLPNLTALRLGDFQSVTRIPRSLWGQLTRLEVNPRERPGPPPVKDLIHVIVELTSLRRLTLVPELEYDDFSCEDTLQILDALPSSVEQLDLWKVAPMLRLVHCYLEAGRLTEVHVSEEYADTITLEEISTFVTTALLPSSKLGPRLHRLKIDGPLWLIEGFPVPGPTAAFFRRCDSITLDHLTTEVSAQSTVSVIRHLGMPEELSWGERRIWSVRLGGTARGRGGSLPAPVPPGVLLQRALQRMAASTKSYRPYVVLTGPPLLSLLAVPAALKAWLQQLTANLQAQMDARFQGLNFGVGLSFCTLSPAGAVIVRALRDGEESWGPESASGGAGASGSSGQGGGSEGGELDRLQILLESWDGVRSAVQEGRL
ncbi:hypothetical protein HYH03_007911 [Edaphochlamys debaryana]|uniref:Uncharacterized protein n=1 Tax=Edaphochlamys debaryana TaxID=47281 RepID=A0A835YAI1_9CHLO|nr:hypothetical protein HYH03_007911 [Edaphochlamys debaryana]|eukprot:KAG2493984.1 hypothetical protein HYH03_007911 [Edaphochlamys debaryana]